MTRRERVAAVAGGRAPDRVPVSFWRHVPEADPDPERLAQAMIAFQRRFDLDLVKLMPSGMYSVEDYGCEVGDPDPTSGARRLLAGPLDGAAGWARLEEPLPPDRGARGRELSCLRWVRRAFPPGGADDVPVLQTVFSPLTTAAKAAGRDRLLALLRADPARAHRVLSAVARTERDFTAACLEAGADGVFFATQFAGDGLLTEAEYAAFGEPYDRSVLQALAGRPHLSILHLHGMEPLGSLFGAYAMPLVNWHDRRTAPDLVEGIRRLPRAAAAGGLDEHGVVLHGPWASVAADVRATVAATGGRCHLLSPGCVLPLAVPEAHLEAVRAAVEPSA